MSGTRDARDRLEQISALFEEARAVSGAAREALLAEVRESDAELYTAIVELLSHHEDDSDLLDQPVVEGSAAFAANPSQMPLPERIGEYQISGLLGAGGMGMVYRARQAHPDRDVAIKVMRPGLLNPALFKRFELETTVLGRLQHPNVAQIYEAGFHEHGETRIPYFVMEFIDGPTLSEFLAQENPALAERLRLFSDIAKAVHYAHQKGVIHRDLKPSNILIQQPNSDGGHTERELGLTPKILDFGVARATDADLQSTTYLTDVGQLVGTLPYMSPEQINGQAELLDVRSDVYALGVMLFETLSGELPYRVDGRSIAAAARTITESEPQALSIAGGRFNADLQTIVAKALEKEPDRRYQSAAALTADLRRYLNDEPIEARPPSTWYQVLKFAQRNRGLVAGLVATMAALTLGIAGTTWQAITATQQRKVAESDSRRVQEVNQFLRSVFTAAHASHLGDGATIREAIEHATRTVDDTPPEDDRVEADIRHTIAVSYEAIAEYEAAEAQLDKVVEIETALVGRASFKTLSQLGLVYSRQNRLEEAESMLRSALEDARRERTPLDQANAMRVLAEALQARTKWAEAEELNRESLRIVRSLEGRENEEVLSLKNLATALQLQARYDEAEQVLLEAITLAEATLGPNNFHLIHALNRLGINYDSTGRSAEAVEVFERVLELQKEQFAPDHPDLAVTRINLGSALHAVDRSEEAERAFQEALTVLRERLGANHGKTLIAQTYLAQVKFSSGEIDEATKLFEELVDLKSESFGRDHVETSTSMLHLAEAYRERGDFDKSVPLVEEALAIRKEQLGPVHPRTVFAVQALARTHTVAGDTDQAKEILSQLVDFLQAELGADHADTIAVREALDAVE